MKICIILAPGLGDAVIFSIAAHHLSLNGHDVTMVSPHDFGRWFPYKRSGEIIEAECYFLQHDNSEKAKAIRESGKMVYTFFGSYKKEKHGPLKSGFDYVSNLNETMVENVKRSLKQLFSIDAISDPGIFPPKELQHRKYPKRIVIHATSGDKRRNWPLRKFEKCANWAKLQGLKPEFLCPFDHLEDLFTYIYESGYFLGNDSGPGHIASALQIPNLVIGKSERHMRHWRPGWEKSHIITPPKWVPNIKPLRIREKYWKETITTKNVIKELKRTVLRN